MLDAFEPEQSPLVKSRKNALAFLKKRKKAYAVIDNINDIINKYYHYSKDIDY